MLSESANRFATGILYYGQDLCLTINSSVNAYRRLDPAYEAPNEIKMSATDRGSMIRIPIGNEKSARIEVRTVAPDANPYIAYYTLVKCGLAGMEASDTEFKKMEEAVFGHGAAANTNSTHKPEKLPAEIETAITNFEKSAFMKKILGAENHEKFASLKRNVAARSPRALGSKIKNGEILFHHEVYNQMIWTEF